MARGAATVARKRGGNASGSGSETRRYNSLVRMDDDLVAKAKKLAALRGVSMAEMFCEVLRPWVDREWSKEVRKLKEDEA